MSDIARERRAIALFEAALDVPEAEREAMIARETGDDDELAARVRSMLAAHARAAVRTGAAMASLEPEVKPERVGSYRIEDLLGRGGMGSVYRAHRDSGDFDHVVAVKVIKPGLLSEALVERFRTERRMLAGLVHPNIARLYDGGETADGAPYLVMEYVEGLPLLDWLDTAKPSRAERTALFLAICEGVSFAHARLIVHRDLTPSNVLVARDGSPKLIDFGIARLAEEEDATRERPSLGSMSLTPGYAAPERMTGAAVTTGSDIYSLGKILALVLPPAGGAGKSSNADDADLRAIAARATAAERGDRYPSADALAADIRAWAAGFPVQARPITRRYVAAKFLARHRLPVLAASLVLVLLTAALVVALVASRRAEVARAEAETRFVQTRGIARTMLFDVFDQVTRTPGSTAARQVLAQTGATYLDALAATKDAPLDVRLEAGRGYLRLAEVIGGGQAGSLSRYKDGDALLARSQAILEPLHREHPDDPGVAQAYASLLLTQASTNLYNNNKTALARTLAQHADSIITPWARTGDQAAATRMTAWQVQGDADQWDDRYDRALPIHRRVEAYYQSLPPALRAGKLVRMARSVNMRLLGEAAHKLKRLDESRAAMESATAINRGLVADDPKNPQLLRKLINSLRSAAVFARTDGRDAAARAAITEAAAIASEVSARDPDDVGQLHNLALVQEVQAQILGDVGDYRASFAVGDGMIAAHRKLVERAANAAGARRSLAQALRTNGGNHYNGRDYPGACRAWRESRDIMAGLDREGVLSAYDRDSNYAEMKDYTARACDQAGPRAALGPSV